MDGKRCFDRGEVVVRKREGQVGDLIRHSSRAGNAERGHARPRFHQQAVRMAVIAALKLDDDIAPGSGTSQADGRHGGLGSGTDEAHLLDRREARDDALGQVGLGASGSAKAGGAPGNAFNGLHHRGKRVAQDHRAPRTEVIDVAIAVRVGEPCPFGALDERRRAAHRAKGPDR